jgi:hypothetical protein
MAEEYLRRWVADVKTSDIAPLVTFSAMLEDH